MTTPARKDLLNPVDAGAIALAARLLGQARHASLAVLQPQTGWPQASRVALGRDGNGTPVILISQLSTHFAALQHDARCCLLAGEPGSGDPLAYPRISLDCRAQRVPETQRAALREPFVARQPKAALYVDFADFAFWRLEPVAASLNGGFGKAFALTAADLQAVLQQAALME